MGYKEDAHGVEVHVVSSTQIYEVNGLVDLSPRCPLRFFVRQNTGDRILKKGEDWKL